MQSKNHDSAEEAAISEILQVIEKHGISALWAEKMPEKIERAIKLQNILLMDETRFKSPESHGK